MDFAEAMRELTTSQGVSRDELDSLETGILALAVDAAAVSGWSVPEAQGAIEDVWLAYDGPQALIGEGRHRYARRSAMHREYRRRTRRRRR